MRVAKEHMQKILNKLTIVQEVLVAAGVHVVKADLKGYEAENKLIEMLNKANDANERVIVAKALAQNSSNAIEDAQGAHAKVHVHYIVRCNFEGKSEGETRPPRRATTKGSLQ